MGLCARRRLRCQPACGLRVGVAISAGVALRGVRPNCIRHTRHTPARVAALHGGAEAGGGREPDAAAAAS